MSHEVNRKCPGPNTQCWGGAGMKLSCSSTVWFMDAPKKTFLPHLKATAASGMWALRSNTLAWTSRPASQIYGIAAKLLMGQKRKGTCSSVPSSVWQISTQLGPILSPQMSLCISLQPCSLCILYSYYIHKLVIAGSSFDPWGSWLWLWLHQFHSLEVWTFAEILLISNALRIFLYPHLQPLFNFASDQSVQTHSSTPFQVPLLNSIFTTKH
jgi:hypothetical protein